MAEAPLAAVMRRRFRSVSGPLVLACSGGGHAELLSYLGTGLERPGRIWVMPDGHRARWLRQHGERTAQLPEWHSGASLLVAVRTVLASAVLALRLRPAVVVTTGSGMIVPFCLFSRLLGADLLFVETPARLDRASRGGQVLGPLARRVFVQWESMTRVYRDAVVCVPPILEQVGADPALPGEGTFLAVGTHRQPFDRLLRLVDEAVGAGILPGPVVAQGGSSRYEPQNYRVSPWLRPEQIEAGIRSSRYVVAHGGSGIVTAALRAGRRPLVLGRRARFGEHVDDHQLLMLEQLADRDLIVPLDDRIGPGELARADAPLPEVDVAQRPTLPEAVSAALAPGVAPRGVRQRA